MFRRPFGTCNPVTWKGQYEPLTGTTGEPRHLGQLDMTRRWRPPESSERFHHNVTMVIDSRSFLEYNTSNVQQSVNVCCSKLVKRRLQQDKVHVLDLLHQTCNIGADETWDVVVYDQCTEDPSLLTPDNFVQVLLHKLSTTFNSVAFLKGNA
ncbi:dual specificity protein phosphatase 8 [Elysia marginata]|uniref:Dual specificity protein phosphatase 8 n=1 Tax=Elysia marginata TaxID=1093978 RepID=A0AAV4GLP8_9GAST|nr:dual specificity protein phosphatase 8 [Elysia marginata]